MSDGEKQGGPRLEPLFASPQRLNFDEHTRQVVEKTYRINRLHIAAMLLGGVVSADGGCDGDVISLTEEDMNDALAHAEELMRLNDERKVVMP